MENQVFRLTGNEAFDAKRFRIRHKRLGCKFKGILGGTRREIQKEQPTYSYIFRQTSLGDTLKYVRCNICGEQEEITEKSRDIQNK